MCTPLMAWAAPWVSWLVDFFLWGLLCWGGNNPFSHVTSGLSERGRKHKSSSFPHGASFFSLYYRCVLCVVSSLWINLTRCWLALLLFGLKHAQAYISYLPSCTSFPGADSWAGVTNEELGSASRTPFLCVTRTACWQAPKEKPTKATEGIQDFSTQTTKSSQIKRFGFLLKKNVVEDIALELSQLDLGLRIFHNSHLLWQTITTTNQQEEGQ